MNKNKPVDKEPYEVPVVCDILPVTVVSVLGTSGDDDGENDPNDEGNN